MFIRETIRVLLFLIFLPSQRSAEAGARPCYCCHRLPAFGAIEWLPCPPLLGNNLPEGVSGDEATLLSTEYVFLLPPPLYIDNV